MPSDKIRRKRTQQTGEQLSFLAVILAVISAAWAPPLLPVKSLPAVVSLLVGVMLAGRASASDIRLAPLRAGLTERELAKLVRLERQAFAYPAGFIAVTAALFLVPWLRPEVDHNVIVACVAAFYVPLIVAGHLSKRRELNLHARLLREAP